MHHLRGTFGAPPSGHLRGQSKKMQSIRKAAARPFFHVRSHYSIGNRKRLDPFHKRATNAKYCLIMWQCHIKMTVLPHTLCEKELDLSFSGVEYVAEMEKVCGSATQISGSACVRVRGQCAFRVSVSLEPERKGAEIQKCTFLL